MAIDESNNRHYSWTIFMQSFAPTWRRSSHAFSYRVLLGCALTAMAGTVTLLSGCASVKRPIRRVAHLNGQLSLYVIVAPDANGNTPIAVDVVLIDDVKLLAEVSAFTADAWFMKRKDIEKLHPGLLHVTSWEWVPGEQVPTAVVPSTAIAAGVLLFAHYGTPGSHAAVLPQSGSTHVTFGAADFQLLPAAK